MYLIGKTAEALTKRQWDTLSRLSAHFLDSLQGLTTLKELGRSKEHAGSIAEASDRFRDVTLSVLRVTFLSALVLELVATRQHGARGGGSGAASALRASWLSARPCSCCCWRRNFISRCGCSACASMPACPVTTAARRIFEILDIPESDNQVPGNPDSITAPDSPNPLSPVTLITLKALSYTYPGEIEPALKDISPGDPMPANISPWWAPAVWASPPWQPCCCALSNRTAGELSINDQVID